MSIEYPHQPVRETPLASDDEVKYMLKRLHLKWGDKVRAGNMSPAGASDVSGAVAKPTASAGGGELQPGLIPALPHSARPAPLEWLKPVKNEITGTYAVKDLTGAYTVLAERRSGGEGWQYLAFHGSAVLAPSCATAECAKAHCIAHHERESPCP